MDNDDRMIGRILNRREVLALLGATGVTLLLGCADDDDDEPTSTVSASGAGTATTTTQASGAATTAPTQTQASAATATATSTGTTAAATATTAATSTTAASTATAAESGPTVLPACVVSPELTEGPYFVDEQLERSDIRADPASGAVVEGAPLELVLRVLQVGSEGCTPLAGAVVDVWHCDALGVYSDVSDPGFNTEGQQFLRGYQVSDADGLVRFTTIYPGWYEGRAVHIHFKIRGDAGSGQSYEFTSQFFFDEAVTDEVHAQEPYASKGYRTLLNEGDMIYQEGGNELMLAVTSSSGGYAAAFDIGVQLA